MINLKFNKASVHNLVYNIFNMFTKSSSYTGWGGWIVSSVICYLFFFLERICTNLYIIE